MISFSWNDGKNEANKKNHGVSFKDMRKGYDFSKMKGQKNPYIKEL